jgi:hypothetical protein
MRSLEKIIQDGGCDCDGCVLFAQEIFEQEREAEIAARRQRRRDTIRCSLSWLVYVCVFSFYVIPLSKVIGDFWAGVSSDVWRYFFSP